MTNGHHLEKNEEWTYLGNSLTDWCEIWCCEHCIDS